MRTPFIRNVILCLIGFLFFGCPGCPFFGDDEETPKSRVSLASPIPASLQSVSADNLFVDLYIYDNKKEFEVVQESELTVANGMFQFEEFRELATVKAAEDSSDFDIPEDITETFEEPETEIVLRRNREYTFVIIFQAHVGGGVLLPVAYIQKVLSFDKPSVLLWFLDEDFTFDNPADVLNDLSPNFNVNGIELPNLDADGDFASNLSELLDNTDPSDVGVYPTPDLPRCGNGIVNAEEQCDDGNTDDSDTCNALCQKAPPVITVISPIEGQSVRDVVIILAEASSEWGVRSLVLQEPSGVDDRDFSSETFQGIWDTTNLPEGDDIILSFIARDEDGRERTASFTVRVDNAPNIVSFGESATINRGSSHNLSWVVSNYSTLSIDNLDDGARRLFTPAGSTTVSPTTTTTYTLTARRTNPQGQTFTSQSTATVSVNAPPSVPVISKTPGLESGTDTLFEWNASSPGSGACSTITYSITVKRPDEGSVRGEEVFAVEGISGTSFNTTTLSGDERLEPRSDYEVQIAARDNCGLASNTGFVPFSTEDSGLVGWWRFEQSANLGLNTADTTHHNGTLTDGHGGDGTDLPAQVDGVTEDSKAMSFEDFDPYLDLGDDDGLADLEDALTVELWVNPSEEKDAYIISHGDSADGWIVMQEDNDLRISVSNGTTAAGTTVPDALSVDGWNFVSFSYDGSRIRTYINGFLKGNPALTGSVDYGDREKTLVGTSEAELGGDPPPANEFFKGLVDEVAIYNRALSSSEIRANCRRSDPGSVCAALGVPEPVFPANEITLPPNRAFISWEQVDEPTNKTIVNYTLCYVADGDISGPNDCLNSKTKTVPYHVVESLESSSEYSWKVYANYNDGSRSLSSTVWEFTTDASLIENWDFESEGGIRELDGTGSETIEEVLSTDPQSAVSIEARAKVRDIRASYNPAAIVSGGGVNGWLMQTTSISGKTQCLITTDDGGDALFFSSFGFATDDFNHVVCLYDQALGKKRIYMNNNFGDGNPSTDDEVSATGDINYTSFDVIIGGDPNHAGLSAFDGFIDEIAIYSKALSAEEIVNNFCALEVLAGTSPLPDECQQ